VKNLPRGHLPRALSLPGLVAVALATAAALAAAVPAWAASGTSASTVFCGDYQHVTVTSTSGTQFLVKNDNYGGYRECLANRDQRPNFKITTSGVTGAHTKPQAYPFVFLGCSWGTCAPGSTLPRKLSALRRPAATWQTSQTAKGTWNAAFDLWFGKHSMITGQANAEVMIWLGERNIPVPAHARIVSVDNARWYLVHMRACYKSRCWTYVQFRRVRPTLGVKGLRLSPFITRAEARGWIKPSWWMENIEAGFEVWRGGTGLATTSFSARA